MSRGVSSSGLSRIACRKASSCVMGAPPFIAGGVFPHRTAYNTSGETRTSGYANARMIVLDEWLLTAQRAAVRLPSGAAVVADVHLGYGEARRQGGDAVPLADPADALAPLRPLVERQSLRRLVVAGDLFEAGAREELVD